MRRKTLFTLFQISLFVPEIFKFLKYANWTSDDVIHSTKFWSNMMKKDISANLYQKCLILCSKILLNVFHNMSLTVLLPWQHTGFQASPILKAFLATFGVPFWYLLMVPHMSTSFPGSSLYLEKVPWLRLVTCLLDFSRFQRYDRREGLESWSWSWSLLRTQPLCVCSWHV